MHEKTTLNHDNISDITLQLRIDNDTHANDKKFLDQEIKLLWQELAEAQASCLPQS